ncbi:PREDICTED: nucleolar and coiled-body phosphoprotein 1-like [Lupinus angustifolius]|uniref:nucleolar and coiled-body phosphoprotein 1-like n=1 Tax=Lupinus angustifolius TaxID=3871 RepID=UPI00092F0A84|nr:PREDICTED: nucleolar and coiled-body phosphoprotein 1-like [Lupinus angustifolius]
MISFAWTCCPSSKPHLGLAAPVSSWLLPTVYENYEQYSKKRKRPTSEENGQQVEEIKADEEPKRRKVENVNESKGEEGSAKTNSNLETSKEQANGKTNGHLENVGDKSSVQKSQQKGSVEVMVFVANISEKGFQRIQADQVEFADERLQDNSYWAKDGAESGYGAKAQEILGQVRGRDFRHEKTKKKRGTYRGGQIDLYSHSVKFNYSDEE